MSSRPPITILSPTMDYPVPLAMFHADPLVRVAITSDEPEPTTVEGWNKLATEHGWPHLMASVERRGLTPEGAWTMIVDTGADWRRHISLTVQHAIDQSLLRRPEQRVVCVALLVDSATVRP